MFVAHGATFLSLKTTGPLAGRASRVAMWLSPAGGALVIGTAAWLAAGAAQRGDCRARCRSRLAAGVRAGLRRLRGC